MEAASETLDFTQPIALMLLGIVHRITDTDDAYAIVDRLIDALAPGSFLAIHHATNVIHGAASDQAVELWNQLGTPPITLRTPTQIARFFDGLWLVEPGIVSCSRWRPGPRCPMVPGIPPCAAPESLTLPVAAAPRENARRIRRRRR